MIRITVPGSKSLTNRALLAAALTKGKSKLINVLESDDTKVMRRALPALLKKPSRPIFCGNSGTTLRFLAAVLATRPYASILTGNARMKERPVKDLAQAIQQLGASVEFLEKNGFPPIRVQGPLLGGTCKVNGNVSSQFLSGLLFAAPLAKKSITITVNGNLVSKPYIDLTLQVMKDFGILVKRNGYKRFFVKAPQHYQPKRFEIEGDASSASYFWAISSITGEPIKITNIPKNSKQADMQFLMSLRALQSMAKQSGSGESGLLRFARNDTATLRCRDFPDSAMTLAVLAAFRKGKTILTGLANLRMKECDRLHALTTELRKIGARVKELKDGLEITGNPEKLHGARIKTYNDHRMAMCFGMASFVLPGMKIENPSCVKKTYPNFWKDLHALKKKFHEKNIVLTGMRGSGKSRLGALLGRWLGRRFYDIDELIEQKVKKSIPKIVAKHGWKYFRNLENQIVKRFRNIRSAVIATGGGTLMHPFNIKILKSNGKIIFLESAVASLKKRLAKHYDRPPLTRGEDSLSELETIYRRREKRYKEIADAVIDVSRQTGNKKHDLDQKLKRILIVISRFGLL